MTHHILVADDDAHIRDIICFALDKAGMTFDTANNGIEALKKFQLRIPDLIVLDVGMPEMDGLEVCRNLRKTSSVPILFLSARDEEIDRILGLEMGGDDYVTKPFSPRELVARINTIMKRTLAISSHEAPVNQYCYRGLVLNKQTHEVIFNVTPVHLTALEFSVLQLFISRPGVVFSRGQILDLAYGHNIHVSDRTIDSHVRNIRAKLMQAGCANAIETVHGVGFRLGKCEVC